MAASFTIAARNNGFTPADARAVSESVKAYRLGMAEFAAMRTMDIWYAHMTGADIQDMLRAVEEASESGAKPRKGKSGKKKKQGIWKADKDEAALEAKARKIANKTIRKAHTRDSLDALTRFAEVVDGRPRIVSRPPVIIPSRFGSQLRDDTRAGPEHGRGQFRVYKATLSNNRRQLLDSSPSSTWHARWSASAASVPERSWCCKAATAVTPCSSR